MKEVPSKTGDMGNTDDVKDDDYVSSENISCKSKVDAVSDDANVEPNNEDGNSPDVYRGENSWEDEDDKGMLPTEPAVNKADYTDPVLSVQDTHRQSFDIRASDPFSNGTPQASSGHQMARQSMAPSQLTAA
jgi:hypothetical protein